MRTPLLVAAVLGFLGVALGAFGAHGIEGWLKQLPDPADAAKRMAWWHTAVQYHMVHALLAVAFALVASPSSSRGVWVCVAGVTLFSGSLYAMTLTGITKLGMVTPLGGLAFLAAWVLLAMEARAR